MKICYIPYNKKGKTIEFNTANMCKRLYSVSVIPEMYMLSKFCGFFGNNINTWLAIGTIGTIGCSVYWVKNIIDEKIDFKAQKQEEYYKLLNEFNQVALAEKKLRLESLSNVEASKSTNIVYSEDEIKKMFY